MILLDYPYISDDFIRMLKRNNFPVVITPEAKVLVPDESLNWITEEEVLQAFKENPETLFYTTSENSIGWVEQKLQHTVLPERLRVFKNKLRFRELLQDMYPDYFFKGVKYEDLRELDITGFSLPFIIKPAVGFFSIGVQIIEAYDQWQPALDKIDQQLQETKGMYPAEVVRIDEFIIEENIEGEEYAIDCYFDAAGKPVVLMILHHVFSSSGDVGDRVYTTSKEIVEKNLAGMEVFLQAVGERTGLKNFPAHIEVRVDERGMVRPIEINPLRFGGWCTTADLTAYAFGFSAYEYFFHQQKPDWPELLRAREGKNYSIIILDNSTGVAASDIAAFDYDRLLNDMEKPLSLRKIDHKQYGVFGFLFTETSDGNDELERLLTCDLKKYITTG